MTKEEREHLWQTTFIACRKHPERRCNRSDFVNNRSRRCASCVVRGTPSRNRNHYRSAMRWAYKRSMRTRERFGLLPGALCGLKLFERITGYDYR